MYAYPVLLPAFSNREDFLLTASLFDDDTAQPINLSGINIANPGNFTGSNWTVTDGSIVTSSSTPITIINYPLGGDLTALALTVGTGLAIVAGDPVVISDPTGTNTMIGYVVSYASSTGALVCQIGVTFQFEIRSERRPDVSGFADDYTPFFDFGGGLSPSSPPLISASLGNGITHIDVGVIQILIPESIMRRLANRTYLASLTMTDSVNTRQIFIGKLPTQWGGVTI